MGFSSRQKDFPREIEVGDDIWEVRFCRRVPDEGEETVGLCDPSDYLIWIKQGLSPRDRMETFIHEVLHAIEFSHDIDIPHRLVYAIARHWTDICIVSGGSALPIFSG